MSDPRVHDNGYFYTGVRGTDDSEREMKAAFQAPYMVVGSYLPESPQEVVHRYALAAGLPNIRGFYGYDFGAHEFICEPSAVGSVPDDWQSRKLDDVLKECGK